MPDPSKRYGIFRGEWTGRKAGILGGIGATLASGVTSLVIQQYVVGVLLLLLGAVFLYMAEVLEQTRGFFEATQGDTRNLLTTLRDNLGRIEFIAKPEDVFSRATQILERTSRQQPWDDVFIYSPYGLWERSSHKDDWLQSLGRALNEPDPPVSSFTGVFVLPRTGQLFDDHAERRLRYFEDCPVERCQIQYLPPEDADHPLSAPGMGMIIFVRTGEDPKANQYEVLFGFAHGNKKALGTGFILRHPAAGEMITSWLEKQVLKGRSRPYTLKGLREDCITEVTLEEGLAEVRKRYYSSVSGL
ncbi:MAG: hypothetical protein JWL97_4306 [Gemmatimonadales bacterium]|nr:hypothetical protein [Gemmatimonadales bacterium]